MAFPAIFDISTINGSNGFRINGTVNNGEIPFSISTGDFNGDGFDDLAMSHNPDGNTRDLQAYVVFGTESGIPAQISVDDLNGTNGTTLTVGLFDNGVINKLDFIGDFNGDGFDDLVVYSGGATQYQFAVATVVFGTNSGAATISATNNSGATGLQFESKPAFYGDRAVASVDAVSSAGDINGDGFADLMVGDFTQATNGADDHGGKTYVFYGTDSTFTGRVDLNTLDGVNGFVIDGNIANENTGVALDVLGDVNNDGISDIIIGSKNGAAYVVFGKIGGFGSELDLETLDGSNGFRITGGISSIVDGPGDVNGDGYDDILVGTTVIFGRETFDAELSIASLTGPDGFTLFRSTNSTTSFGFAASGAGDINSDGYADIVVGAPGDEDSGYGQGGDSGQAWIFFGKADGYTKAIDVSQFTGAAGFVVYGDQAGMSLGRTVGAAGDINGDGYDDVVIGAPYADPGTSFDGGTAVVIYGGPSAGEEGNTPPIAFDDTATVLTGESVIIDVLANDQDADGDTIVLDRASIPARGTAVVNADGTITYTPEAGWENNFDAFTYFISDGKGGQSAADVVVRINAPIPNEPPTAPATNAVVIDEDTASGIVAIGAADSDGGTLAYSIAAGAEPSLGFVTFSGDGFVYTPTLNASGADSFTILIEDGQGGSVEQVVSVTINPIQDPPVASDDLLRTGINETLQVPLSALLANDADADGDLLGVVSLADAVNGVASLDGDTLVFTPFAGFEGQATFTYTISDGNGGTDSASVTVIVADNSAPVLSASQAVTTLTGTSIGLYAGASDPDGDVLTYAITTAAGNGTASVNAEGMVTYAPDAGFAGSDTFTLTVDDGNGGTATQTISVTVTDLPDAGQFRFITTLGYTGAVGGSGNVVGTAGFQDISVIDVAGHVSFDGSFNRGEDIVRLAGNASDWFIVQSGSAALLSDGDTFVEIPAGRTGLAIVFDDGVRTLKIDDGLKSLVIGDQAFGTTFIQITADADGSTLPTGADEDAVARLILAAGGTASLGGSADVVGTNIPEPVRLISGEIRLDGSFNRGGDTIILDDTAETFTARTVSSTVLLQNGDTLVEIPAGTVGLNLGFDEGADERLLFIDNTVPGIFIGDQLLGADAITLAAASAM